MLCNYLRGSDGTPDARASFTTKRYLQGMSGARGLYGAVLSIALAMLPSCAPREAAWPIDPRAGEDDDLARECAGERGASFVDAPAEVLHDDGLLWLRGERGALASLDLKRSTLAHHFTSEVVVDVLSTRRGTLWVLTYDPIPEDVRVWERTPVGWTPLVQISAPAEPLLALGELGDRPLLVTARALYLAASDGLARGKPLARPIERALAYSAIMTADDMLWVAVDRGELGGSLLRIDPFTGEMRRARMLDMVGPCSAGAACTRVTSLLVDPEETNCVLASVGAPKGRMARLCGPALAPEIVASPPERQLAEQAMALAFVHPAGSPERERLRMTAHSLMGLAPLDNMTASSVEGGRRVRALAPSHSGYLAIAAGSLYRSDASGVSRLSVKSVESRCGLDLTLADGAVVVESPKHDRAFVVDTAAPGARRTIPTAPCEGAEVYYAWGYTHEAELLDWGYAALLSCRAGEPVLLERGNPNRRVKLERRVWEELWRDLERARWRTWSNCTGAISPDEPRERLVIARGDHSLRVDCPVSRHRPEHEAAVLRIRHIAGMFAEDSH